MEQTEQKKTVKRSKRKTKDAASPASVRIKSSVKEIAENLLDEANKKNFGRKIKLDELLEVALRLVGKGEIEKLQQQSQTAEDRQARLRQIYIETRGEISRRDFLDFMMTREYLEFLGEHHSKLAA